MISATPSLCCDHYQPSEKDSFHWMSLLIHYSITLLTGVITDLQIPKPKTSSFIPIFLNIKVTVGIPSSSQLFQLTLSTPPFFLGSRKTYLTDPSQTLLLAFP